MSCSYGPTPSNIQYKTILLNNLVFCCQHAVDIQKLLNLLYNESIISKIEQQIAENYNIEAQKMEKLMDILLGKDYKYFPWLIKCLEESQNKYLADRLVSSYNELNGSYYPPPSPTTVLGSQLNPIITKSDFPVQSTKVLAISKKLVEEHFVLDNWMLILEGFQLQPAYVHQIHNMILRGELHPQLYIQKTLQIWLSNNGSSATWSTLIEILTSSGCASGAILDRNRELYQ